MTAKQEWYKKLIQAVGINLAKKENVCVVVGAMPQNNMEAVLDLLDGSMLIAADAGLKHVQDKKTALVVGDFDSLGYVPSGKSVLKHPVRKDDTDMMLAIRTALSEGKRDFVLLGGIGGRLDHTIANMQTLNFLKENDANAILIGERESVFLLENRPFVFDTTYTGLLSVFSFGEKAEGVTIKGLSYEAEKVVLTNAFPLGVSNAFVGKEAFIEAKKGILLIMAENP